MLVLVTPLITEPFGLASDGQQTVLLVREDALDCSQVQLLTKLLSCLEVTSLVA